MNKNQLQADSNKSIAVLPFVNMSSDPENEYFSDGITEEIINALTTIKGLKVIARTSSFAFKNKNIDVRTIGKQLGVNTVLEGSVRKARNSVRITAQLIDTNDGTHFWSRNFDRELKDIFALQDEVSLLIADQIRENFGHIEIKKHLIEAPTQNIEAYNLYLKGRYHQLKWNSNDLLLAIEYYKQSIAQDESFALPYFGAGISYGIMATWQFMPYEEGIKNVGEYLNRGFALNKESYLSHFALGTTEFWGKWNFKKAHTHLLKSINLNPSFTDAEGILAELYTALGDFDKAMQHIQHILEINPFSPNNHAIKGSIEFLTGEYELAIESLNAALQIDTNFSLAIEIITLCYIQLKEYENLDNFLNQAKVEMPMACRALFHLKYPDENIDFDFNNFDLMEVQKPTIMPWNLYLQVYMGNQEMALDILEKSIAQKSGQIVYFQHDPFLSPLYQTKLYQNLVAEVFQSKYLPEKFKLQKAQIGKSLMSANEATMILKALERSMKEEELYENASLSLRDLAEKLAVNPNKLSWLLNEHIGQNFNQYINTFRLAAFKEKLLNPKNNHITFLGLAYESGFNSKTAFNAFFKKMEGITPSTWVKKQTK